MHVYSSCVTVVCLICIWGWWWFLSPFISWYKEIIIHDSYSPLVPPVIPINTYSYVYMYMVISIPFIDSHLNTCPTNYSNHVNQMFCILITHTIKKPVSFLLEYVMSCVIVTATLYSHISNIGGCTRTYC